ncbi:unnamed protein product, partial [Medioppia subpectinata]
MSVMSVARPVTDYSTQFNELEGNRFQELSYATQILAISLSTGTVEPVMSAEEFLMIIDLQKLHDIKNVVKMCKMLVSFKGICDHDKIVLLKYGAHEVHCMRSITYYDIANESWTINLVVFHELNLLVDISETDDKKAMVLRLDFIKDSEIYCDFREYINNIFTEIDSDMNLLNMAWLALSLLQQHVYMYLLKRYLLMKYRSEWEADDKFNRLMNTLIDLYYVESRCKHNTITDRPDDTVPPLLRELWDISDEPFVVIVGRYFDDCLHVMYVQKCRHFVANFVDQTLDLVHMGQSHDIVELIQVFVIA